MSHRTSPGIPVQSHSTAECHASREPFDAAFRVINERRDIGAVAKLVHAHLVTLHRTQRDATQTEIGEAIGCSRHQVWRAIDELVAGGLVQTIRYGLGRPNGYILLGIDQETLDGKSGRASGSRPDRTPQAGQTGTPARAFIPEKKKYQEPVNTRPDRDYYSTREGPLRVRV